MNGFDVCGGTILFLIICCGICGNLISLLVWNKGRRCKKLPGGIYLRALAVSDTIALCIPATNEAINLVSEFNPREESHWFCKVEIIGKHFGLLVSSWIIVAFTVERTLAIFRPGGQTSLISQKGTIILMIIIFLVNFILNFPFGVIYGMTETAITRQASPASLSTMELTQTRNTSDSYTTEAVETATVIVGYKRRCTADRANFFHYLNWYHLWFMDAFLIFIIPFGLMTVSNLMVLYFITSRKNTARSKIDNKIKAVTMRAVTISVAHCVTSGGFAMSVLIPGFLKTAFGVKYSQEYYINKVFLILAFLNHSINFILYSFFGTEFRRDCTELFRKMSSRVIPGGVRPLGTTGDDITGTDDSRMNKTGENSCKTNISSVA